MEGDITALPFPDGSFDVVGSRMVLHHVARPEQAIAELTRVTRPGGTLLVADQVAPIDPMEALVLNQFESARDPSHTRVLSDQDFRGAFESNNIVLTRSELVPEERQLDWYLDLAGCAGTSGPARRRWRPAGARTRQRWGGTSWSAARTAPEAE